MVNISYLWQIAYFRCSILHFFHPKSIQKWNMSEHFTSFFYFKGLKMESMFEYCQLLNISLNFTQLNRNI